MSSKTSVGGVMCPSGYGLVDNGVDTPTWKGTESFSYVSTVTFSGEKPDWRRRIRNVQSATSTLSGTRKEVVLSPSFWSYTILDEVTLVRTERYRYGCGNYVPAWPDPSIQSETKANNQALVRFVKRAQAVNNSFQGSVAVGELGETLRMIRNPAMGIRKGLDDYLGNVKKRIRSRRSTGRGPLSSLEKKRIIADTWLEHAFGWRPLFSDVQSAAEALARRRHELRRETVYIRAGGSSQTSKVEFPGDRLFQFHRLVGQYTTLSDVEIKYYGVVKREVYNDYAIDAQLFGFDPTSWLPTVWELIPYSFLIDYFANVGNIVNAYAFNRASLAWVNKGTRKRSVLTNQVWFDVQYARDRTSYPKRWIGHSSGGNAKTEHKHTIVTRAQYTGSLVPTIEFQIPGLGLKWINMAALAASHADARRSIALLG